MKKKQLPAEEAKEYREIASEIIRLLRITGHRDQLDILRIQVWDAIKQIDQKPIIMKDYIGDDPIPVITEITKVEYNRIPCTHSTARQKDFCPKCFMNHIG